MRSVPVRVTAEDQWTQYSQERGALTCSGTHTSHSLLGYKQHTILIMHLVIVQDCELHRPGHSTRLIPNAFYSPVHIPPPLASSFSWALNSTRAAHCTSTVWQRCARGLIWLSESECTDRAASKWFTESSANDPLIHVTGERAHPVPHIQPSVELKLITLWSLFIINML